MHKNKTLLIIILAIIFLLFSHNICSATTTLELTDEQKNWLEQTCTDNSYTYYFVRLESNNYIAYFVNVPKDSNVKFGVEGDSLYCSSSNYTWFKYVVGTNKIAWSGSTSSHHWNGWDTMYSNTNVHVRKNGVMSDEVFFKPPVQEIVVPLQGEVAPKLEEVQMIQVLKEVVAVLPLILVILVSLVGLRKALRILLTLLRQS